MNKNNIIEDLNKFLTICDNSVVKDILSDKHSITFFNDIELSDDNCTFHPNGEIGCIENETNNLFGFSSDKLIWMNGWDEYYGQSIQIMGNDNGIFKIIMICDGWSSNEEELVIRENIDNCISFDLPITICANRNLTNDGCLYQHGKTFFFSEYKEMKYNNYKFYIPEKNGKGVKIKNNMLIITDYVINDNQINVKKFLIGK